MKKFLFLVVCSVLHFSVFPQDPCDSAISVEIITDSNKLEVHLTNNKNENCIVQLLIWEKGKYEILSERTVTKNHITFANLEKDNVYKIIVNYTERTGFCQFRQMGGLIF